MRFVPARRPQLQGAGNRIIFPGLRDTSGVSELLNNAHASASTAWQSANDPQAIPFCVTEACVVHQLGWRNGSSAGNNWDIGIYTTSWVRLVSAGSTVGTGNSAWQWVDVTDTPLPMGRYYLVVTHSTTTANRASLYTTGLLATILNACGVYDSTTDALPLPDPLTNMVPAATFTRLQVSAIATRVPY